MKMDWYNTLKQMLSLTLILTRNILFQILPFCQSIIKQWYYYKQGSKWMGTLLTKLLWLWRNFVDTSKSCTTIVLLCTAACARCCSVCCMFPVPALFSGFSQEKGRLLLLSSGILWYLQTLTANNNVEHWNIWNLESILWEEETTRNNMKKMENLEWI